MLAHFSGDPTLCEAFARDEDIHARVASQVYGVPLDEVTRDHAAEREGGQFRRDLRAESLRAGQGNWVSSRTRRREFIDAYFEGYPGIEEFLDTCTGGMSQNWVC